MLIGGFIDSPELLSMNYFKITKFNARNTYTLSVPKCTTDYAGDQPIFRKIARVIS